ncbi:MAG TPA: CHRD domain-containing protein [Pseudonocardiaceae bacterium]|nr:CHRD domain-containing protein [Pseudonocardiaceae bacterium]
MRKSVVGAAVALVASAGVLSACSSSASQPTAVAAVPEVGGPAQLVDLSSPGGPVAAMSAPMLDSQPGGYTFRTVDDPQDPTFNQLLGINDQGQIAGYFGSGAAGHPNKGYLVRDGKFAGENVPGSVQTQVTGIDNLGATVGFSSRANNANQVNDNTGFVLRGGAFHPVSFPAKDNANPPVNQLLGINDDGIAAGFYTDSAGNNHGYTINTRRGGFSAVTVPGSGSVTAAAINDRGQLAGFDTNAAGITQGFLRDSGGKITVLAYPGANMTQALGLNNRGEVVGVYQAGSGAATHGFTWTAKAGFKSVDDPDGISTTTVNGVNDAGVLVGFYVDGAGNTHGMLAKPSREFTERLNLSAMPNGTVAIAQTRDGHLTAHLNAYGFTPGSAHQVEIDTPSGPVVRFPAVTASGTGVVDTNVESVATSGRLPSGARFVIRIGDNAGAVIGQSAPLPSVPHGSPTALTAVNQGASGRLAGTATLAYDPAKQTLTVTVNATGTGPGNHAAHVHNGTCQAQGSVRYMLMDYTADAKGDIVNQTRTVTGVPAMAAGGWYLNLHLGDGNSILGPNQQPTLSSRPLLCANG